MCRIHVYLYVYHIYSKYVDRNAPGAKIEDPDQTTFDEKYDLGIQ